MMALADQQPIQVIGETGLLRDKPGFEVEFLSRHSLAGAVQESDRHNVLMGMKGYWSVRWDGGELTLSPGILWLFHHGCLIRLNLPCRARQRFIV